MYNTSRVRELIEGYEVHENKRGRSGILWNKMSGDRVRYLHSQNRHFQKKIDRNIYYRRNPIDIHNLKS